MGCCISTPKDGQNALKNQQHVNHETTCSVPQTQSKSPPLIVEEEFVKEVLSETETPISKPQQVSILRPETKTQMHNMNIRKDPIMNKPLDSDEPYEEVSLVSEICSVGESFSTTTTTTTVVENREDEVTSKPSITKGARNRHRNRAHSDATQKCSYAVEGNRVRGRERGRPKSPARLPEIAPEKKVVVGSRPRRTEFSDKCRRDSGEGTCRRSRSPSRPRTVANSTFRSELRQTDRSGRWLQTRPSVCDSEKVVRETNDSVSMEELIMNTHVSLECFIFL